MQSERFEIGDNGKGSRSSFWESCFVKVKYNWKHVEGTLNTDILHHSLYIRHPSFICYCIFNRFAFLTALKIVVWHCLCHRKSESNVKFLLMNACLINATNMKTCPVIRNVNKVKHEHIYVR